MEQPTNTTELCQALFEVYNELARSGIRHLKAVPPYVRGQENGWWFTPAKDQYPSDNIYIGRRAYAQSAIGQAELHTTLSTHAQRYLAPLNIDWWITKTTSTPEYWVMVVSLGGGRTHLADMRQRLADRQRPEPIIDNQPVELPVAVNVTELATRNAAMHQLLEEMLDNYRETLKLLTNHDYILSVRNSRAIDLLANKVRDVQEKMREADLNRE